MKLTIEEALQQGVTAHKEGKLQEAERIYQTILQAQPTHPDANHNLGVIAVSINKADVALPLFKSALDANPKIEQFWLSYIDALIKDKQFNNAEEVIEQSRKYGLAVEKLNVLETQLTSKNKPENIKNSTLSEAEKNNLLQHYQNGRLSEAEKLAVYITQQFPENPFGWKVLGAVLKKTGRVSQSLPAMKESVRLKPQDAGAHNNLGSTLQELDKFEKAEISFRQAIALKPDFAEAHGNLGDMLQKLGRLDKAIDSFKTAYQINPNLDIEMTFAEAYLRNKDPDNALPLLEKFLKKHPQDARANAYKTIALRGLDEFDQTEELISFQNLVKKIYPPNLIKEDLIAFNKELRSALVQDPRRRSEDNLKGWAIRGGTVIRNLFNTKNPSILQFEIILKAAINQYIVNLPDNTKHPFLMMKTESYELLDCWVNFLQPGDYQSNHIHNNGTISGVYYLDEPETESNEEHAGWIEFNRAGYNLPHFAGEKGIELIKPKGGMFILFPSYVWHGTIPYTHSYSRISISFDIKMG
ncbi:tetratricopeptide repeat protein [Hyphomicrobiales bacterium]|nr:tetratricopeptide repeat protein [Hyphomicrobiales bacterium]